MSWSEHIDQGRLGVLRHVAPMAVALSAVLLVAAPLPAYTQTGSGLLEGGNTRSDSVLHKGFGEAGDDFPSATEGKRSDALKQEPRSRPAARFVSRAQAADRARKNFGGRVLSVRWTGAHYRVKLLEEGEIRIVEVEDRETEE